MREGRIAVFGAILCGIAAFCVSWAEGTQMVSKDGIEAKLRTVSIPFVKNEGQVEPSVLFHAKILGGAVLVSRDGTIVHRLVEGGKPQAKAGSGAMASSEKAKTSSPRRALEIREVFVTEQNEHWASRIRPVGEEPSVTKISYFRGRNPSGWYPSVETFDRVNLGEIWNGIEVKLKAHGDNVEKLFYVRPGADPSRIMVRVDGGKGVRLNEKGEIEVDTELGIAKFSKPIAYQLEDGKRISVSYELKEDLYTFRTGDYDREKTLVIDPLLASTFVGGDRHDHISSMVVDPYGNVYVAGMTVSVDYPVIAGALDGTCGTDGNCNAFGSTPDTRRMDAFISKFDNGLTTLLASTFLGGEDDDSIASIALDELGNVFVAGQTTSDEFPVTLGAYQTAKPGGYDAFVCKLNASLTSLLASTYLGGRDYDEASSVLVVGPEDRRPKVCVAGNTRSNNFPTTPSAYDRNCGTDGNCNGKGDAFVACFTGSLSTLVSSTFVGGSGWEEARALALGGDGRLYLVGVTDSTDFPTTANAYRTSYNGGLHDIFVVNLPVTLDILVASTLLGGDQEDNACCVAMCGHEVCVAGLRKFLPQPHYPDQDVAIYKLSPDLRTLVASRFLGGQGLDGSDEAHAMAIDASGNIYVAGTTSSEDYPTTEDAYMSRPLRSEDIFLSKLSPDLNELVASTYFGSDYSTVASLAIDPSGNVFLAGTACHPSFPTTPGAYDTFCGTDGNCDQPDPYAAWFCDGFVSKFDNRFSSSPISMYTLNVEVSGHGSVASTPGGIHCIPACTHQYSSGTLVTLSAMPEEGFELDRWEGDCSTCAKDSECLVIMNRDVSCAAIFSESVGYSLTVRKTGTGSGIVRGRGIECGDDCSEIEPRGIEVSLLAIAGEGSRFASWGGDCEACGSGLTCNLRMDSHKECTARFDRPGPDLTGSWESLEQSCKDTASGLRCKLKGRLTVTNQGDAKAQAGATIRFYLSQDTEVSAEDLILKELALGALAPGRSKTKKLSATLPTGTSASGKYVIGWIDPTNAVEEKNEDNNLAIGQIP